MKREMRVFIKAKVNTIKKELFVRSTGRTRNETIMF